MRTGRDGTGGKIEGSTRGPRGPKNNKIRDESDEDGCKTIVMKENYSKAIAPFIFDAEKDENLPARVNVSLSVIDVVNIKEVDHTYNLKFKLRLQWFDYR